MSRSFSQTQEEIVVLIVSTSLSTSDQKVYFGYGRQEFAISAVLSQKYESGEMVIAYFSKTLSKTEQNYCQTRKELLAVVKLTKNF